MKKEPQIHKTTKKYRYSNSDYKEKAKKQANERVKRIAKEKEEFYKLIIG
jgi:hypothetical protein